ncbi:hypothetical protein CHS0354_027011 [Potamilus streckersoni]|uniref:Uncharacterized protein n=1 Tax=Potamilus streckersoni TaxID=2493646 RepID=A0AAE0SQY3_9BIVA|nr:hypothetical protein CHS0354_027011 [Potamilus streckersoni]
MDLKFQHQEDLSRGFKVSPPTFPPSKLPDMIIKECAVHRLKQTISGSHIHTRLLIKKPYLLKCQYGKYPSQTSPITETTKGGMVCESIRRITTATIWLKGEAEYYLLKQAHHLGIDDVVAGQLSGCAAYRGSSKAPSNDIEAAM